MGLKIYSRGDTVVLGHNMTIWLIIKDPSTPYPRKVAKSVMIVEQNCRDTPLKNKGLRADTLFYGQAAL